MLRFFDDTLGFVVVVEYSEVAHWYIDDGWTPGSPVYDAPYVAYFI